MASLLTCGIAGLDFLDKAHGRLGPPEAATLAGGLAAARLPTPCDRPPRTNVQGGGAAGSLRERRTLTRPSRATPGLHKSGAVSWRFPRVK